MASSTLKTQFSPYIAQLGMPSKGMLYAFGDAVDEYELDKRKDILFGIEQRKGELAVDKGEFDLSQSRAKAPLELQNAQNQVSKSSIELEKENFLKTNGMWQNSVDESKQKLEQAKYDTTNKRIESENKDASLKADMAYKGALTSQANASTHKTQYGLEDDDLKGFLYQKISEYDADGNGVIDANEKSAYINLINSGGVTIVGRDGKKRQSNEGDARLFGEVVDAYEKTKSDLKYKESQTKKNEEANLGLDALTKKVEKMKESGTALAKEFGYEDWSHLGKVDVSKLTPEQQAKFQAFGSQYLAALGEKDTEIKKKAADITNNISMLKSSTLATQSMLNGGNNVQFFDKALNDVGQYIGVPFDKELAKRNKDFQLALNTQLKMMSGTAVSANEYARFQQASSNLYRTNQDMYIALRTLAEKQNNELQGLEMGIGAVPMNAKYGVLMQNSRQLNALFENASAQSAEELKPQLKGRNQPSASKPSINLIDPKYF